MDENSQQLEQPQSIQPQEPPQAVQSQPSEQPQSQIPKILIISLVIITVLTLGIISYVLSTRYNKIPQKQMLSQ